MNPPYAHIACCIDESDASRRATAEARRLWDRDASRLSLVHVVQWPPPYVTVFGLGIPTLEDMRDSGRRWLGQQGAGVPGADTVLLTGHPASAACEWAEEADVDLLVAGVHRGPMQRIAMGSFAHYLVHHSPCPVLLVRPVGGEAGDPGDGT